MTVNQQLDHPYACLATLNALESFEGTQERLQLVALAPKGHS